MTRLNFFEVWQEGSASTFFSFQRVPFEEHAAQPPQLPRLAALLRLESTVASQYSDRDA